MDCPKMEDKGLLAGVESVEDDIVFSSTPLSLAQIMKSEYSDSQTPAADGSRAHRVWNLGEIAKKMKVNVERSPIVNEEEDQEKNWDPMGDHYFSGANRANIDPSVPGASYLGALAPKLVYKSCDIQCRFYKEEEDGYFCIKGPGCPNMHLKKGDPQLGKDGTRVKKLVIAMAKNFLPKIPMYIGAIFDVKVSYAYSPEHFYITKESNICLCDVLGSDAKIAMDEEIADDIKAESISEFLTKELRLGFVDNKSACFRKNEIVAVKVREEDGSIKYYRGLMLEDVTTFPTEVIRDKEVLVTLIDTGETKKHLLWKIFRFDTQLADIVPPKGYKCSMTGISPLTETWSPQSCEYFKRLIESKHLQIEVENTVLSGKGAHLERKPYEVKLSYIQECYGRKEYIDVADQMVRRGHGVAWNRVPNCPPEFRNKENNNLVFATKRFDRL